MSWWWVELVLAVVGGWFVLAVVAALIFHALKQFWGHKP